MRSLIDKAVVRQAGAVAVAEDPKPKLTKAAGGPDLLTSVPPPGE